MGRSRLTLKRISNNAIRKSTFMKRRDGLVKKVFESCTSRDIAEACLIVFDDDDANDDPQPMMTWPEDLTKVQSIIRKYESRKNEEEETPTMFGIQEYFAIKKDLVKADISKVRKEIVKIKYPTWDPRFNSLGDEPLRNFIAVLDSKIEACKQRKKLLEIQHEFEAVLAQTNNAASNSTQDSFMQNNFQSQLIPTPMDNQVDSSLDFLEQLDFSVNLDLPLDTSLDFSEQLDFSANLDLPLDTSLDVLEQLDFSANLDLPLDTSLDISEQLDFSVNLDIPLDTTKQSEAAEPDWDNLHELLDCASQANATAIMAMTLFLKSRKTIMGRARLTLKRIPNDPLRKSTCKQRMNALKKKMQEFSKLCKSEGTGKAEYEGEDEVEACLIVYNGEGDPQPLTWPENLTTEYSLIQKYESQKNKDPPVVFSIEDYFQNKKDKIEGEISKIRKDILKITYPTLHPSFNNLIEEQIRNIITMLDAKSKACSARIDMLKMQQQVQVNLDHNPTNSVASNSSQHAPTLMKPIDENNHIASSMFEESDVAIDFMDQDGEPDWDNLIDGIMNYSSLPYESLFDNNLELVTEFTQTYEAKEINKDDS
ncbi:unnamed protein product [Lupinus luteus]|uniref:MADS-box domain-containing protein n=1 Tax=Lupinus luteus TaxID=3873 RepID=A0AAV1W6N1_LUPLU